MPITIDYNSLPYTPSGIECLRLGARRGGEGIGCCAIDVIQGFNNAPDAICPQQPFFNADEYRVEFYDNTSDQLCLGGEGITNEQVFLAQLTHGSFTPFPEPDHGFIVTMTENQISSSNGQKWLTILKREGFKWVGCVSNSVYGEYHPNHIFMLLRSTHENMDDDEIQELKSPPSFWESLPEPLENPEERFNTLRKSYKEAHTPATQETKEKVAKTIS